MQNVQVDLTVGEPITTKNQEMLTKASLKARGWTDSLSRKFLGEPDVLRPNPHYRSAPKMQLYRIDRVIEIEQNEAFEAAFETARKRSEARKNSAIEQAERLREYIRNLNIEFPVWSKQRLTQETCDHYNQLWRNTEKRATPQSSEDFLCRIAVNFLRHGLTPYDMELYLMFGRIGSVEGRVLLKARVLECIAETYPFLKDECERQRAQAWGNYYYDTWYDWHDAMSQH